MEIRLNRIYSFLKRTHRYNHAVQDAFYNECTSPYQKAPEKAKSLLYHILNTQSQPRLEKVAEFWQTIQKKPKSLSSFAEFSKAIDARSSLIRPFDGLFEALKNQPGWGHKTSALFIKAIYDLHKGGYKKYGFWKDVPALKAADRLLLPVDSVIAYIFKKLSGGKIRSFTAVNRKINEVGYKGIAIQMWDDLWYWGFITQKGTGSKRKIGFNNAKYWALLHTNKSLSVIKNIKVEATRFKKLVTNT